MLYLHRSNRVERLASVLAEQLRREPLGPFVREHIVVQGPGMERWLSMQLSTALSVWANPFFPFPRTLLELTLDDLLGPAPAEAERYREGALMVLIASLLPTLCERPELEVARRYLARSPRDESLLSLARELAHALDQRQIYRPDTIFAWEQGASDELLAVVWRAVVERLGPEHFARRLSRGNELLRRGVRLSPSFPSRISLFGISSLPPSFLQTLGLLAAERDVHLYLLSPSREYLGDLDRRVAQGSDLCALVANLSTPCRELSELLEELPYHEGGGDLYEEPAGDSLLAGLQADLLSLAQRSASDPSALPPRVLRPDDASLTIHRCHSPLREIEVLRDQLRARFEADPSLLPEDVVVLAPDIDAYASAIEATLTHAQQSPLTALPFRIADRRSVLGSEVGQSFFALLRALSSRLYLSEVLDLLELSPLRERAEIDEGQLTSFRGWLERAGARWGEDGAHRAQEGLANTEENTLRFALDRLLLGFAAPDTSFDSFANVLPHAEVEGGEALALGLLGRFLDQLFYLRRRVSNALPLEQWPAVLGEALARLDDRGERALDAQLIRSTLHELSEHAQAAHVDLPVSLFAVTRELERRLSLTRESSTFLTHGVTFCEHVPMRAIPFRVVCMVGLDDDSFPRRTARGAFDAADEARRLGDRSGRDDDKQLFLDALLSARDAVIITYPGKSPKDDSVRPASVVVEQLLRVIDSHFVTVGNDGTLSLLDQRAPSRGLLRDHALLRFDARYFEPGAVGLCSYDQQAAELASALRGTKRLPQFAAAALPAREEDLDLTIHELTSFFRAPARAFLSRRLGLALPRELAALADREPLALDPLERFRLGAALLEELAPLAPAERARVLRQQGNLPPGDLGVFALSSIARTVDQIEQTPPTGEPARVRLDYAGPRARLRGELTGVIGNTRVERMFSMRSKKHELGCWIRHLCYQVAERGEAVASVLITREGAEASSLRFGPEPEAASLLNDLLALYRKGLRMPLPFFVKASATYAEQRVKGEGHEEALKAAGKEALRADPDRGSELEEPHAAQCFSHYTSWLELASATLDVEGERLSFDSIALRVYAPLLTNLARCKP